MEGRRDAKQTGTDVGDGEKGRSAGEEPGRWARGRDAGGGAVTHMNPGPWAPGGRDS